MPVLPAFCETCGTVFSSGFVVGNIDRLTMNSNKSGPCPTCGGMGSLPEGTISIINNAIHLISGPAHTVEQFKQLQRILSAAQKNKVPPNELAQQLERECPVWQDFVNYIYRYLVPKNAGEFWGIIAVIIAALPFLSPSKQGLDEKQVVTIVEKAVNSALEKTESQKHQMAMPRLKPTVKKKKIGRNDPCPCQSGKKYKRCCGSLPLHHAK